MIVTDLKKTADGGRATLSAEVCWEGTSRRESVHFEVDEALRGALGTGGEAFLTACAVPAMLSGEERLRVEGTVCPELLDGVGLNLRMLRQWYGREYVPPALECFENGGEPVGAGAGAGRTAVFLSGGLDSLFSLRMNRLHYAGGHPRSARDGIFVHGFDISRGSQAGEEIVFERAMEALRRVAAAADIELVIVRTNIRNLYVQPRGGRTDFWSQWYHGSALAAVGHALSARINRTILASSHCPENLEPWGSHPLLDPNWGSARLEVAHDPLLSRLEKTKVVAEWPTALRNVRVCLTNPTDRLNCGFCVPCVKTMAHLFVAGRLDGAEAFADKALTTAKLRTVCGQTSLADLRVHYVPILGDLERMGRTDLAEVVRREFSLRGRVRRAAWKKRLFALDGRWAGGAGARLYGFLARAAGRGAEA